HPRIPGARGGSPARPLPPAAVHRPVLTRGRPRPRSLHLPVLRRSSVAPRADPRSRPAPSPRRPDLVGEHRARVLALQPPQGRPDPRRSRHAARRQALPTALGPAVPLGARVGRGAPALERLAAVTMPPAAGLVRVARFARSLGT